jgi:hypothetical protein
MSVGGQSFSKLAMVLNDAVVHQDDIAAAVSMGMSVAVIRHAVGSPTRVPYGLLCRGEPGQQGL